MKRLQIIKIGTTFPNTHRQLGDFDDWIINTMGHPVNQIDIVDILNGQALPDPVACSGVIVTGSHAMVTDHLPWSVAVAEWIPGLIEYGVPYLGICYGHQLLAQAMGGVVGDHPKGQEIGTVAIDLLPEASSDPLFATISHQYLAHVTHVQTVLALPDTAVRLASNRHEANHAIRIGACAWGIQFHPEYDIPIMKSYIMEQAPALEAADQDIDGLLKAVRETPESAALLKRFAELVDKR